MKTFTIFLSLLLLSFSSFSEVSTNGIDDMQRVSYHSTFGVSSNFMVSIFDNNIIVRQSSDGSHRSKKHKLIKVFNLSTGSLILIEEFNETLIRPLVRSDLDMFLNFSRYYSEISNHDKTDTDHINMLITAKNLIKTYLEEHKESIKETIEL